MSKCDYCNHAEMCGWRKDVEEQGCEFFDDGNKWIPCEERLPEVHEEPYYADCEEILHESDHVLTCCRVGKGFVCAIGTIIYDEVCNSYEWSGLYDYSECEIDDMSVVAWMPLPKPYMKGADYELQEKDG